MKSLNFLALIVLGLLITGCAKETVIMEDAGLERLNGKHVVFAAQTNNRLEKLEERLNLLDPLPVISPKNFNLIFGSLKDAVPRTFKLTKGEGRVQKICDKYYIQIKNGGNLKINSDGKLIGIKRNGVVDAGPFPLEKRILFRDLIEDISKYFIEQDAAKQKASKA